MLSVLMQCTVITAVVMVIYVLYGYSMSFGGSESAYWGGLGKTFLVGRHAGLGERARSRSSSSSPSR